MRERERPDDRSRREVALGVLGGQPLRDRADDVHRFFGVPIGPICFALHTSLREAEGGPGLPPQQR